MKTCENCGERVYNLGCVNCNEMAYIEEQDRLTDLQYPEGSIAKDSGGELHDDGSVAPAVESQSTQRLPPGVA
jgi:hypothetical protein